MTSLFSLSSVPPAPPSNFSVHLVRVLGNIDLTPHLVPLDKAKSGDLVGMMSGLYVNVQIFPNTERALDSFYVQGENGVEVRFYEDLVGPAADHAAHLVAEKLFMGEDLHQMVLRCDMVDCPEFYQVQAVHFADATLYINHSWITGGCDDGYDEEEKAALRPIVLEMGAVFEIDEIAACHRRTCRYLDTVRRMLPLEWRDRVNWNVALPPSSAYLEPMYNHFV